MLYPAKNANLQKTFAVLALIVISLISALSGYLVFRFMSQHLLERDMTVSADFVQSAAQFNNLEPYFKGSTRDSDREEIEKFFRNTSLIPDVLRAAVYDRNRTIIWSDDQRLIGRQFDDNEELEIALAGNPVFALEENEGAKTEHQFLPEGISGFVENYLPIRSQQGEVIGVIEIYKAPTALFASLARGRQLVIASSILGGIALFLALFWIVRRASVTIESQEEELKSRIRQLSELLDQNRTLRNRIQQASSRAVATNERFLRRIGSDLHDGPAQSIGFALLRLDAIRASANASATETLDDEFDRVRDALDSGLRDIRSLSAGLVVPELAKLSLVKLLQKVVGEHEQRAGGRVRVEVCKLPEDCALSIKICAYRFVQEGLNNALRHAPGATVTLQAECPDNQLLIRIGDDGPGFDPEQLLRASNQGLGLAGLRERIESLGGDFTIRSKPGEGTTITLSMPLESDAPDHG